MRTSNDSSIDTNGNCIHHPVIKVKRQTTSGEWKTLLSSCPLCAIRGPTPPQQGRGNSISSVRGDTAFTRSDSRISHDNNNNRNELRRLSSLNGSRSIVGDSYFVGDRHDDDQGNYDNKKYDDDRLFPLQSRREVSVSSHDMTMSPPFYKPSMSTLSSVASTDDTAASSCSASSSQQSSDYGDETAGRAGVSWEDELSCQPCSPSRRQYTPDLASLPPSPYSSVSPTPALSRQSSSRRSSTSSVTSTPSPPSSSPNKKAVVCGLKYMDPASEKHGSYTGQLNPGTKLPHGIGTLRYTDGSGFCEGKWIDGVLVTNIADRLVDVAASSSRGRDSAGRSMSRGKMRSGRSKSRDRLDKIKERLGSRRSKSRGRRESTRGKSRDGRGSSEQHQSDTSSERTKSLLGSCGDMEEEGSWYQPSTDVGNDLQDPEPPVVNTTASTSSGGHQRMSSQVTQNSQGSYSPRQNTDNRRRLQRKGSSAASRVVEVAPPVILEQQAITTMVPYQNNQDQDDNVKHRKPLETATCDKSQYSSEYSRSGSDLGGGGSRGSVGPYSSRASSFCMASSYTLVAATSRGGVGSRQQHALDRNHKVDQYQEDSFRRSESA